MVIAIKAEKNAEYKLFKQLNVDLECVQKPQLDEQKLERIEELLYNAIEYNYSVVFILWIMGYCRKYKGGIDEASKSKTL